MLGGWLALLASATFAISNVSVRRGVITGSVLQGLAVTVPVGVPLFLALALAVGALGEAFRFAPLPALYLSLAGILHFIFGRYCNYRAINAIGANLAVPVQQSSLLVSLAVALWLLDERLTPLRILGIVLVLLGPAILLRAQRAVRRSSGGDVARPDGAAAGFRPRYAEGYTFGVLSAVGYGISPIFVRAALKGADAGVSIAGGLVSYVAATVVVALVLLSPAARRHALSVESRAARWFAFSGFFVCVSQMIRYMALAVAPVSVVAPILRMTMVFSVMLGWVINRDHEVFGLRIVAGILVSLLGALALTLSTDFVLSIVALPDFVIDAARWRWPQG